MYSNFISIVKLLIKIYKHLPRLEMLRLVSSPWLTVVSATIIIFVVIYVLDASRGVEVEVE